MSSTSQSSVEAIARAAKTAFEASQLLSSSVRETALRIIADQLEKNKDAILQANREDMKDAQQEVDAGHMSKPMLNRLDLGKAGKWEQMVLGVTDVASLPDPTGIVSYASELDDGLELYRVSCPIGVLLVIFEARPEVVVNIAALAIRSGNAAILKGGKESNRTTVELAKAISEGLNQASLPPTYIQAIQTRAEVSALLALDQFIDLVIPRGSNALVKNIQNNTRIPVMGHADGLCHVYLHKDADRDKAIRVAVDSKIDYPSACNAVETLLVHRELLHSVWVEVARALLREGVQLICDSDALSAIPSDSVTRPKPDSVVNSTEQSYHMEHLDLKLSVKTVDSLDAAIQHINTHSSHHTDTIVTESGEEGSKFCRGVDSAGTFINASTRFADGFRYGFGTEVGISTGRIHARGPVGLEGLVIYKYMMLSKANKGHVVGEFGDGKKSYKHTPIKISTVPF
ncbi:glutamate-5-semialdehyde dehydrogenase [Paxillus ammoniavirescens]|nr:glutamate-5-semialdehyde dehydrogenase [Paxillus ammoniavirescens]